MGEIERVESETGRKREKFIYNTFVDLKPVEIFEI